MSVANSFPVYIHNLGLPVNDSRIIIVHHGISYGFKYLRGMERIARVKKYHIVALGNAKPLVLASYIPRSFSEIIVMEGIPEA